MEEASEVEAQCERARQCLRQRQFDQAIELFREAVELDPSHAPACEGLAAACFHAEDYDGAIEQFNRLVKLRPRDAKPYVNLGAVYNRTERYDEAVAALQKAVQQSSQSSEAFYNLGIAYRNLDQLGMAVTAYREAIRLNPDSAEAHVNLANVYIEMSNFGQASSHFREALTLKPGLERAEAGLQRTEEASEASKLEISPFGRLVDTDQYARQSVATGAGRSLSSVERVKDCKEITDFTKQVADFGAEVHAQLRDELTPTLMELSRSLAEGADRASNIINHQDEFVAAVGRAMVLRRKLRESIDGLRQHEKSMTRVHDD